MKKNMSFLKTVILIAFFVFTCQHSNADTLISRAYPYNDAQYVDTSTGTPTVDGAASFNAGGWTVYRVYYYPDGYGTGFTYNASLIEIDLSQIPSNGTIDSVILNINVVNVIQEYNYDTKLAILSHLRSSGYTGDAESDYWYIDGPPPEINTLYYFYSGSSAGWKQIDVTNHITRNLDEGINWAVFWISPAPWEDQLQIIGEAKGVSVAGADYNTGILAPYLEIHTTSSNDYDFDTDGDVDGLDLYSFISEMNLFALSDFATKFGVVN